MPFDIKIIAICIKVIKMPFLILLVPSVPDSWTNVILIILVKILRSFVRTSPPKSTSACEEKWDSYVLQVRVLSIYCNRSIVFWVFTFRVPFFNSLFSFLYFYQIFYLYSLFLVLSLGVILNSESDSLNGLPGLLVCNGIVECKGQGEDEMFCPKRYHCDAGSRAGTRYVYLLCYLRYLLWFFIIFDFLKMWI